jgi:threonyl-tRNA synthetase
LVIGEEEEKQNAVNVRTRDSQDQVLTSIGDFIISCKELEASKK